MEKIIVTQEVLDLNPELIDQGVQIGEEIELGKPCNEEGGPIENAGTADGPGPRPKDRDGH